MMIMTRTVVIQIAEANGTDEARHLPRRFQGGGIAKGFSCMTWGRVLDAEPPSGYLVSDCLGVKRVDERSKQFLPRPTRERDGSLFHLVLLRRSRRATGYRLPSPFAVLTTPYLRCIHTTGSSIRDWPANIERGRLLYRKRNETRPGSPARQPPCIGEASQVCCPHPTGWLVRKEDAEPETRIMRRAKMDQHQLREPATPHKVAPNCQM
ncbi:hypothetical protein B0I37DRAFT_91458 [Chaetomium sp. MPI-CAGE-AT-0009]|nr:hypothetical protein B0I37DRAFT_91458 [Chaetomium sp. MPI-CAGE-AT-0009]